MEDSRPRKLNSCYTAVVTPLPRYAVLCTMQDIMKWLQLAVTSRRYGSPWHPLQDSGQRDLLMTSPCIYLRRLIVIRFHSPTLRPEYMWFLSQSVCILVHGDKSKQKTPFVYVPFTCTIVARNLVPAVSVFCLLLKF
jgi:hypothetical protein